MPRLHNGLYNTKSVKERKSKEEEIKNLKKGHRKTQEKLQGRIPISAFIPPCSKHDNFPEQTKAKMLMLQPILFIKRKSRLSILFSRNVRGEA